MSDADAWAQMAALNAGASAQASAAAAENLAHNLGNIIIPGQLGYQAATAYEQTAQQYPGVASQVEAAASRAAAEKAAADQAAQQQAQQAAETQRLTTIQSAQRASTQSSIQEQFNYALQNAKWAPTSYLQPILQSAVGAGVPDAWKLVAASPALSEIAGLSFGTLTKTNFGGYEITPSAESSRRYISDVVAPAAKKAAIIESIVPGVAMTEEQKEAIGYYGPYTGELISVTEPETKQAPTGKTYYVPYGERTQTEIKDISAVRYGETGEVGFYQSLYTPEGKLRNITNLVSSGGAAALQSGMFSEKPLTVDIRTQEQPEKYAASAIPAYAEMVKASPESFSRLGAEAYGGYVLPLDTSRTIESTGAQLSTYGEAAKNLASLVSPQGANLPRSEYVSLPWGEAVAPGTGVKRLGAEGLEIRDFAAPSQFAGVGPTVVMRTQRGVGGADYGLATPYVPSESVMLPQRTTIDVGTIPIVGMFAAPVAGALGLKTDIEAGAFGAFVNPPMRETTKAGKPIAIPEVTVPGETYISKTPTGYEVVSTETKYGGEVTPYVTTQEVAGRSGYEQFKQNIRDVLKLPTPEVGEKAVQLTALALPVISILTLPSVIAEAKGDKEAARYTGMIEPLKGQYAQFYKEPLLAPISAGIGAALGGITGVGAKYYPAIRAAAGEGRAIGAMDTFITNVAPKVLGGLYAADIAGRSVDYSVSGIKPEAVSKARGIVLQEAVPMGAGFGVGFSPRESLQPVARSADIALEKTSKFFTQEPVRLPEGYENLLEVRAGPQFISEKVRPSRPGQIEPALPERGIDISKVGLVTETPSATSLSAVKSYGQRTQGYPARTLQETEMLKGRIATPAEEFFAQPIETSPLAQLSVTGRMGPSFKEQVSVSEYLKYRSELYGQPESPQTQLYRLSRLEPISEVPPPTIETQPTKMAMPNPFAGLAKEMGVRAEPITPKGLETKVSGAPMSKQMLESVVTKPMVRTGGQMSYIEEIIKTTEAKSVAKPIIGAVESQRILPSATKKTFAREAAIPKEKFEMALETIVGEEKRPVTSGKLPKGMQLDYLKEALSARKSEVIPRRAFAEEGVGTKVITGSNLIQQLRQERAMKGVSASVSTSEKSQRVPISKQIQTQKSIVEQAAEQKQKTRGAYVTVGALTASKIPTIGEIVSPKRETKERVIPFVTPTRITPPRETTITTPRITTPPRKTTLKVPGIPPTVPYGGAGAGARGERGRRFTKELRVGTGIGWIDIAGTRRRPTRKK